MRSLVLAPDQATYDVTDGTEVVSVQLDGGASRFRADILNATSIVTVEWSIGPTQYQYLRAFYKTATQNGSEPFEIDLFLDQPILTTHTAYFVAGSMKLASQSGLTFVVTASLEVYPLPQDDDYNNSIMDLYEIYGDSTGASDVINQLELFINFQLPSIWPGSFELMNNVIDENGNSIIDENSNTLAF